MEKGIDKENLEIQVPEELKCVEGKSCFDGTKKSEAWNFLIYSYFIKRDEGQEEADIDPIILCVKRAYRDLSRTLDYSKSISELDGIKKSGKDVSQYIKKKTDFQNQINEIIINQIMVIINNPDDFNDWHKTTCQRIIEKAGNKNFSSSLFKTIEINKICFYYGQAQKWLNMTLKYMIVMGIWDDKLKPILSFLHVPVDEIIIENSWDFNELKRPIERCLKDGTLGKYSSDKIKSWSKWNENEYVDFQLSLCTYIKENKNMDPIVWEFSTWMQNSNEKQI